MSMTPGPWRADKHRVVGDSNITYGQIICEVFGTDDEIKANAAWIARLPALRAFVERIANWDTFQFEEAELRSMLDHDIAEARRLLAAGRGEGG